MENRSASFWKQQAKVARFPTECFIAGQNRPSQSGQRFASVNPATGQVLAQVAAGDTADIDAAVSAARKVFEQQHWAGFSPGKRKRILRRFAELLLKHQEELALLETLDVGKPIADSLAVDIPASARCVEWYAEAIDKIYGEVAPTAASSLGLITREPVGVVGAIVPWNFPLLMAAWKIAPVLAAGNSLVLKPSEKSPFSALRAAQLAVEAGIPPGVFNVIPGFGHTAGKALALHQDVDAIAFTGSTATGRQVMQYAAQSNLKRVSLECGGKSPNIIFADYPDLDRAAQAAANAIFFNQGEMCSAGSRLLLQRQVCEVVLEKITALARDLLPGDPLDPATRLGAIVDEAQLQRVLGFIDSGKREGARLHYGGDRCNVDSGGFFVEPTLFTEVMPAMSIAREEIFGPVLGVMTFDTVEQAVAIANDVIYGLAGAVWTTNLNTAHHMARALRAGVVYVNCYDADDITVPFGGFKQSGFGRDKSLHAFDKYTELKTTWFNLT
jgi:acyl-CoA reductase-like NAD-dependent aldehyde dehydrogenase